MTDIYSRTIFPFKVESYDSGRTIHKPDVFKTFLKNKPKDLGWYAYDIEVLNANLDAVFTVYDIACGFRGGIGEEVCKFECRMEPEEGKRIVRREAERKAKEIEEEEMRLARLKRRKAIVKEILQVEGLKK